MPTRLISELNRLEQRAAAQQPREFDFAATERATKRLVHFERVSFGFGERPVVVEISISRSRRARASAW